MSDTAVDAAQALLVAMDTEEPFRLLRALPGKLEELRAIEWQSATFAEERLAEEISLSQSEICDSASSRIREWSKEMGSLLDAHVRHLQCEADSLQESLEQLRQNRQSDTLPRRHRAKANSFRDLNDKLSRLQDTTAQIQDITHYVCDMTAGFARNEAPLDVLTHKTLHELESMLNDNNASAAPFNLYDTEELHSLTHIFVEDMEKRCEDLEACITFNKNVVDKQTRQIVRKIAVRLSHTDV